MTALTYVAPPLKQRFVDNNGNALVAGLLYTYAAGTSTPQPTYADSTGATPNANPIVLDSRGECNLWLDSTLQYKFVLKDSLGNTIWTQDNAPGPGIAVPGRLLNVQTFAASGTYTPTAGMKTVIVEVQGGGGGGGGSTATGASQTSMGGGGSSGAYGMGRYTAAQVGASVPVTIGAGGGSPSGSSGQPGGTSSFGALLSSPGGQGGSVSAAYAGGTTYMAPGALATSVSVGGTIKNTRGIAGSHGFGLINGTLSGAGGGAPIMGGSGGGDSIGIGNNGVTASAPGAGGGGACANASEGTRPGGSGASGLVVIYEYA